MRLRWIMCVAICALSVNLTVADEFPYTAFVDGKDVPVQSGPGAVHYPTDLLERGTKVEVYRHDPGGWYAVRPPAGSFSLIPAEQLRVTANDGVARAINDEVVVWVGSRLENVDTLLWQVRLDRDELVEVIGVQKMVAADGQTALWYKIAPPAGEFRWIQGKYLKRQLTTVLASDDQADDNSAAAAVADSTPAKPSDVRSVADGFVARRSKPDAASKIAARPISGSADSQPPHPAATATFENLGDELAALDAELSLVVARDVNQWQLQPLRERVQALLVANPPAQQRREAERLRDKIAQFEDLRRRQQSLVQLASATSEVEAGNPNEPTGDNTTDAIGSGVRQPALADSAGPQFDATGWLMPLYSRDGGLPPFVLMDRDGKILQYVTPSPGLNLNRYVKNQIGILGQRGFIPKLDSPHVTAERVVVLDRKRR